MEFYLDDCAYSKQLVHLPQQAGHSVRTPRGENMTGQDDPVHLAHAAALGCTLITKNPHDFELLHDEWQQQGRVHSGILLIYQDNVRKGHASGGRCPGRRQAAGLGLVPDV